MRSYRIWTICQPWATGMVFGPKRLENRPKPAGYRGLVVVHAGKSLNWFGDEACDDLRMHWKDFPSRVAAMSIVPFGAAIGTFELIDALPWTHPSVRGKPFAWGPICHITANPRFFHTPIPMRGQLGMFEANGDPKLAQDLARAIDESRPIEEWRGAPLGPTLRRVA